MASAHIAPAGLSLHAPRAAVSGNRPSLRVSSKLQPVARRNGRMLQARRTVIVSAYGGRRSGGGGFFSGFLLGGLVFGALGYLYAPQISKALLDDNNQLKVPKFAEDLGLVDKPKTLVREDILELNEKIEEISRQMRNGTYDPSTINS
mmetsp:Transcript_8175/g.24300  ORF Transcript_8175/g.24300 Transcript_8175/m.24300 type:complete len:148 (+) Transcript_8175:148-591(+)|eukprot:CAMPEP_0206138550 /NCGR_PEP_ID=MMETSP1473-20131121/3402_1 /ASSEMBLY_ACC=CAM_ASM_001109 /TAXON_ID=1461547 /ORGANISM="Stichococcus sp, Strain RCC1054" /LENGTH=147 /DNA_ID=CAMNT_0053532015 /DNA_START=133 /DNA_END=576 /DNA_ORIENTATION=+